MPTDPLTELRKAHKARRQADQAYRNAIITAVQAGHGYADIAHMLGLSRQSVNRYVKRATRQEGTR